MPFIGIITLVSQTKKTKQHPNHSPFFSELAREFNMTVEKVVEAKDELWNGRGDGKHLTCMKKTKSFFDPFEYTNGWVIWLQPILKENGWVALFDPVYV